MDITHGSQNLQVPALGNTRTAGKIKESAISPSINQNSSTIMETDDQIQDIPIDGDESKSKMNYDIITISNNASIKTPN